MSEAFQNEPVYMMMALLGTALFVGKMVLLLMGGDGDTDLDHADLDDPAHVDGAESFTLISVQSILGLFMGTGWIGLACRQEWGLEKMPSFFVAVGFGFLMMLLTSFLNLKMKSLNAIPDNDIDERAIGLTGRAYTDIPKSGDGIGQIELTVNGKMQILQASSGADKIKAFTSVKVIKVDNSGNLTVTPI